MEPDKCLKRIQGEEKKSYLYNLTSAVNLASSSTRPCKSLYKNLQGLGSILREDSYVEIDSPNGLPSATSLLRLDNLKKNIGREMQELKSKISSGIENEGGEKSLERMIVEKIRSKIYSFDTLTAEEMLSESTPFYETLNTEFILRDRLYLLRVIEVNPFTTDLTVSADYNNLMSGSKTKELGYGVCEGYFEITGFDSKENRFCGYRLDVNFLHKEKKRLFDISDTQIKLKQRYEELLKGQFLEGDIDSMYQAVSGIKGSWFSEGLWLARVFKIKFGPYCDKNTGETSPLALQDIFKDDPKSFVLDVSAEVIEALSDHSKDFKVNRQTELKKTALAHKVTTKETLPKLKELHQGDESVRFCTL